MIYVANNNAAIAKSSLPCLFHSEGKIDASTSGVLEFFVISQDAILLSEASGVPKKKE